MNQPKFQLDPEVARVQQPMQLVSSLHLHLAQILVVLLHRHRHARHPARLRPRRLRLLHQHLSLLPVRPLGSLRELFPAERLLLRVVPVETSLLLLPPPRRRLLRNRLLLERLFGAFPDQVLPRVLLLASRRNLQRLALFRQLPDDGVADGRGAVQLTCAA